MELADSYAAIIIQTFTTPHGVWLSCTIVCSSFYKQTAIKLTIISQIVCRQLDIKIFILLLILTVIWLQSVCRMCKVNKAIKKSTLQSAINHRIFSQQVNLFHHLQSCSITAYSADNMLAKRSISLQPFPKYFSIFRTLEFLPPSFPPSFDQSIL